MIGASRPSPLALQGRWYGSGRWLALCWSNSLPGGPIGWSVAPVCWYLPVAYIVGFVALLGTLGWQPT